MFSSTLTKTNTFTAHSSAITKVIYINGYILTASSDSTVKIWDPSDWSLYGTYTGHTMDVAALISLSNTEMVSAGGNGNLRQWTLTSGTFSTTSVVYSTGGTCCGGTTFTATAIYDACYIPSLNKIAAALLNGNILLYTKDASAITGQLANGHTAGYPVSALALVDNTNGYMASGAGDTKVIIWDVPNYSVKYTLTGHTSDVNCLRFWSASNYLASGSFDATVRLWDTTTGTFVRSFAASSVVVYGFDFLSSSTLAIGSIDTTIKTYEVASGTSVLTATADDAVLGLAVITGEILV